MTLLKAPEQYPRQPILIVDDDVVMLRFVKLVLQTAGYSNFEICSDGHAVQPMLENKSYSLILLDIGLPGLQGDTILEAIHELYPEMPVLMITAKDDLESAIRCMRLGAQDYLLKPFEPRRLVDGVSKALELTELKQEYRDYISRSMGESLEHPEVFSNIVTATPSMRTIFQYVETIAHSRKPVLITGASGVGKELVARSVHRMSAVPGPFVSETVAGYDDGMFSDALFGHVTGAFTGAMSARQGLVHSAESGTLFLDEIGDLSAASQVKLLRLLQEREYRAVGSDKVLRTNARFVFATNRDLVQMQHEGTFRRDLYYRIAVHHIHIPPLSERRNDVAPLLRHFVTRAAAELGIKAPAIPTELIQLLRTYAFPGNVRELEAMVFDGVAKAKGHSLSLAPFCEYIKIHAPETSSRIPETADGETKGFFTDLESLPSLAEIREELIAEAIRRAEGNQGIAARMLGLSRTALNRRLNRA